MADQNFLLRALPPNLTERLRPRLRAHNFSAGQVLFVAGDDVGSIYFLTSGAISLVTELAGGQMIETAMVGRDSVVGGAAAVAEREAYYKAIVQVSGSGYSLDIDTACHLARDSEEFRAALVRHEQLILVQAQQAAACNATHNLNERLARWLLRVRDVTGGDAFLLTQDFMAEMLGVRRTSVSIVAHGLQQDGLISYRRGNVRIEKIDALKQVACECYHTVKSRYDSSIPAIRPEIVAG